MRFCACVGLVLGMLLSWRLWLSRGREFPVLPCFGFGPLPLPLDWMLFLGAITLAGLAVARSWNRWIVSALVAALLILGLLDQMRWQPWAYQYLLCLVPMMFVARSGDQRGMAAALDLLRLVVVAIYTWSGIHKFGAQFQRTYQSNVVMHWLEGSSGWVHELILFNGKLVPWVELLIGALLLLPRARIVGLALVVGTHAFILLAMGPVGTSANSVIWPWNLATPAIALALFWRYRGLALVNLFSQPRLLPAVGVIGVLTLVMPARSYSKQWDQYLSFHLYSGYHQRIVLLIDNAKAASLPPFYTAQLKPSLAAPGQRSRYSELSIPHWAMEELNVPMPSENRLLLRVAKILVERCGLDAADRIYRDYPKLLEERGYAIYTPSQIKALSQFPELKKGKNAGG